MVPADSDGISRVPPYSGYTTEWTLFRLRGFYPLRRTFPDRFFYKTHLWLLMSCPTTPKSKLFGLGSSRFARRYSGNRIFFLFLQVLRCFSSLRLSSTRYVFTWRYYVIKHSGFPHSEISGSKLTYSSPKHIGVSAVLLRLLVPRHPPCALINLTNKLHLLKWVRF